MKKLYYGIGEVSKLTGVEAHRIRYWETKIPELMPAKSSAGVRKYKEADVDLILKLKELIIDKKYSTEGAMQLIMGQNKKKKGPKKSARLEKDLRTLRTFLENLQARL